MGPHFLVLKLPAGGDPGPLTALVPSYRGLVLAAAPSTKIKPLEEGSVHNALLIARFAFSEDRDACWRAMSALAGKIDGLTALAFAGLPWEGWPGDFVPTIATVTVPDAGKPRTYMVIEGTGFDDAKMDEYRDVILPMLRERGAYYVAFELGGSVNVLAGEWSEGIFAISRWPSWELAEDFWYSDRYQNTAIPIRTGYGRFDVQIIEGMAG